MKILQFLKSKTVWAGIGAAISIITGAENPQDPSVIIAAGSAVLGGFGVRHAIDKIQPPVGR
jgi:hypothetical protein